MINSYVSFVVSDIDKSTGSLSGANIGAIVGGTLGGIVFVVILVLGVIYIIRQTSTKEKEDPYLYAIPNDAEMTTMTNNRYTKTHRDKLESSGAHYDLPTY